MMKKTLSTGIAFVVLLLPATLTFAQQNSELRLLCEFQSGEGNDLDKERQISHDMYVLVSTSGGSGDEDPFIAIGKSSTIFDSGSIRNGCISKESYDHSCRISENEIYMEQIYKSGEWATSWVIDRRRGNMTITWASEFGKSTSYTGSFTCDKIPSKRF